MASLTIGSEAPMARTTGWRGIVNLPSFGTTRALRNSSAPALLSGKRQERAKLGGSCGAQQGAPKEQGMATHKFALGDTVTVWARRMGRPAWMGAYEVTRLLPVEGDDPRYWVKSPHEAVTMAVPESLLSEPPRWSTRPPS